MSKLLTTIRKFFDVNNDNKLEYYELHPLFILLSFIILYYIIIVNSSVLIVFKQSKLFILFFVSMLVFSILYLINHNNVHLEKKPSLRDKVYYTINFANIFVTGFAIIYLVMLFFF
jgi:hypothetical protein